MSLELFIKQVKQRKDEYAASLLERPETTSKKLTAGRCQGLQEALDILDVILKGKEED